MSQPSSATSTPLDVAIVGGGVSGLYTAWRLACDRGGQDRPVPSMRIFESGDRVGGRLLTWLPGGTGGGLRAELGGMRFFKEQELVWNLLPQLQFNDRDILDFPVSGPGLRLLLRGHGMPMTDPDPTQRYLVPDADRGMSAAALLEKALNEVLSTPHNREVLETYTEGRPPADREEWDLVKPHLTWRDRPLWHTGFWNMLSDVLDSESYRYIVDAFGYYSLAANWNAAEAMQSVVLDFTQNPAYKTLSEGFAALPARLAERVTQAGCPIELKTRLVSFDHQGSNGIWTLLLDGPDGRYTVQAKKLVLAMPRRSLELLAPTAAFDIQSHPPLQRLIQSVRPFTAFKMFMFYSERWWEQLGITKGRSVCDLPIRQTYYFAPDVHTGQPGIGLVMASYSDAAAVDFWQGMVPPKDEWESGRKELRESLGHLARRSGLLASSEVIPEPPPHLHLASKDMMWHARNQLALLHGIPLADIPEAEAGAFADWGMDPFGGGWNFWEPKFDVKHAMQDVRIPLGTKQHVYIVGEAYSGAQGWVEGALTSAEVTLEQHFQLPRPQWIPPDYYLGW
jgi:monoamine oxidase